MTAIKKDSGELGEGRTLHAVAFLQNNFLLMARLIFAERLQLKNIRPWDKRASSFLPGSFLFSMLPSTIELLPV